MWLRMTGREDSTSSTASDQALRSPERKGLATLTRVKANANLSF